MKQHVYPRFMLPLILLLPVCGHVYADGVIVDAEWVASTNRMYFTFVSWDGSFSTGNDTLTKGPITHSFGAYGGWSNVKAYTSTNPSGLLDYDYAYDTVLSFVRGSGTAPTFPNGVSNSSDAPWNYEIIQRGPDRSEYRVTVRVRNYTGIPTECSVSAGAINIPPTENSIVANGSSAVTVKCSAATNYRLTIGTSGGNALVPYTAGGQVRMSFSGGTAQQPNVYLGRSEKNETTQTTAWATTVPGTALPGTYSASAVLKVDIL